MTDPHPLHRPPMSYVSKGPYTCTFEWLDGETITLHSGTLMEMISTFWSAHPSLHDPDSADRRVIFDGRAVTILGCIDAGIRSEDWVATHEVIEAINSLGLSDLGQVDLIELELSCLYHEEKS